MRIEVEDKSNLYLYEKWGKTDPSITKQVNYGQRSFTSLDAYSQVKIMTEEFGPIGHWGFKDIEMKIEGKFATFKGTFFYPLGSFVIINSIMTESKKGVPDGDFAKKLSTDSMTKAFSYLLMNADVFLGMFDDSRYVQERVAEVKQAQTHELETLRAKAIEEINIKLKSGLLEQDQHDRYETRLKVIDNVAEMNRALSIIDGIKEQSDSNTTSS
jgi:hypothetical protein